MVLKIKLIKPKNKHSNSFYKTTQIKFQSLLNKPFNSFRMRSTQKIIQFKSPWQQLSSQQINQLEQRLQDKPQDLYQIVKEKQRQLKQAFRIKFNRLNQNQINFSSLKSTLSLKTKKSCFDSTNLSKRSQQFLNRRSISKTNPLKVQQAKMIENKLLKKIRQKRQEYESELKSMFKDKRLILETDLPKINKIKTPESSLLKLTISKDQKKGYLPIWKLR